jgi:hypothetical protein
MAGVTVLIRLVRRRPAPALARSLESESTAMIPTIMMTLSHWHHDDRGSGSRLTQAGRLDSDRDTAAASGGRTGKS